MTTYCEETTSLRPGPTQDTVPAGAMPLAQMPRTFHSRIPGHDDLNRSEPRRHVHRPDPRHDSHRPGPRRHDRRPDHRRTDGMWTGRATVQHAPVT